MSTEFHEVRLSREASLGNGTHPRGMPVCRIILAPGLDLGEVLTTLRNPHLFTLLENGESPESGEPAAESEEPEPDGAAEETPIHESAIPEEYRRPLIDAGLTTVEAVARYAADQDLTTLKGIGRKSAEAIAAALK